MKSKIDGKKVRFTFDTINPEFSTLVFDSERVAVVQHEAAEMYGWNTRLTRAAALSRNGADGKVINVTEEMRRAEVAALIEHYHGGSADWNIRASAKPIAQNPVWLAIAVKRGVAYEVVAAEKAAADLAELEAM